MLDSAGEQEITQRALDAEPIQRLLLFLPAAVTQLGGRLADLASLAGRGGESAVEHDVRRAVIAVHMRRRERKLRPDAFKPVPQACLRSIPPVWPDRIARRAGHRPCFDIPFGSADNALLPVVPPSAPLALP